MPAPPTWNPRRPPGAALLPAAAPLESPNNTRAAFGSPTREPHDTDAARSPATQARVVKKLNPGQPGSKKLTRRFGDALVCVRYRQDPTQAVRYTTVELIVDEAPVTPRRPRPTPMVHVRVDIEETGLQRQVKAHGARWDPARRAWYMTRMIAQQLQLQNRVLPENPPPMGIRNGKF
jgi:hypothetical protein